MDNSNLTPEFLEKAQGVKGDDLMALAMEEGIELTDEQLEAVSGGWCAGYECPNCGSSSGVMYSDPKNCYICQDCGHEWHV